MNEVFNINPHTVILSVGPSLSGKTHFFKTLKKRIHKADPNWYVRHLSTDEYRDKILNNDSERVFLSKKDMQVVSKQAFDLLYAELKVYMSYPVNSEVIFVDSTGLSEKFRDDIVEMCNEYNYNFKLVLFSYNNIEEYLKFCTDEDQDMVWVCKKHYKTLKEEVLKTITVKKYPDTYKIKSKDTMRDFKVSLNNSLLTECRNNYSFDENFVIVSDIHGCYNQFVSGYEKCKNEIFENKRFRVVVNGDYIDKGDKEGISNIINLIHDLMFVSDKDITVVIGNHEAFVYNYLKGSKSYVESYNSDETIREHFDSIELLKNSDELRAKFFQIYEKSVPFFEIGYKFILTHAPCELGCLGKVDNKSIKQQYKIRYPKLSDFQNESDFLDAIDSHFKFLKHGQANYPLHIFGHIPLNSVFSKYGKLGIDTGCAYGNELSFVVFNKENEKHFIFRIKNESIVKKDKSELIKLFQKRVSYNTVDLSNLDSYTLRRIDNCVNAKLNFLSGTVSPCNKIDNDIESLEWGLDYYKNRGVDKVVLEVKEMGSRANVYLDIKNIENSFTISRKGYLIDDIRIPKEKMIPLYEKLVSKLKLTHVVTELVSHVIIDAELLPWRALGEDLIEKSFNPYWVSSKIELNYLKNIGFDLSSFKNIELFEKFKLLKNNKTKKELIDMFGEHVYSSMMAMYSFKEVDIKEQLDNVTKMEYQMSLFGSEGELDFKPFAILKIVFIDGSERTDFDNIYNVNALFETPCCIVDFEKDTFQLLNCDEVQPHGLSVYEMCSWFYSYVCDKLEKEGIMIKPNVVTENIAPMLKCRNKEYLRIVYGYDYTSDEKYSKLLDRKKVDSKIKTSISEHKIGTDLLAVKRSKISGENESYKKILVSMFNEQTNESFLDPRL
jgi:predicted kinase